MSSWPPTPAALTPVTPASFRADYPEFGNTSIYPDSAINLFGNEAAIIINPNRAAQLYNILYELYIAHNLMLYKRRQDTAALTAYPGLAKGILASETPGQVSISYDTAGSAEERGGMYNETEYGKLFLRKARLAGMGPVYTNAGRGAPGQVNGVGAWPGPPTGSGYSF